MIDLSTDLASKLLGADVAAFIACAVFAFIAVIVLDETTSTMHAVGKLPPTALVPGFRSS
jgi:hypothetical protein